MLATLRLDDRERGRPLEPGNCDPQLLSDALLEQQDASEAQTLWRACFARPSSGRRCSDLTRASRTGSMAAGLCLPAPGRLRSRITASLVVQHFGNLNVIT